MLPCVRRASLCSCQASECHTAPGPCPIAEARHSCMMLACCVAVAHLWCIGAVTRVMRWLCARCSGRCSPAPKLPCMRPACSQCCVAALLCAGRSACAAGAGPACPDHHCGCCLPWPALCCCLLWPHMRTPLIAGHPRVRQVLLVPALCICLGPHCCLILYCSENQAYNEIKRIADCELGIMTQVHLRCSR